DLANEAYHGRSFDLSADLRTRLSELEERAGAVIMEVLRGAYDQPDRAVLFLVTRSPDDSWRRKLVEFYRKRSKARGWTMSIWRSLPERDVPHIGGAGQEKPQYDDDRIAWEEVSEPAGEIVALE